MGWSWVEEGSGGENANQFGADLIEPSAVCLALLMKHARQFRRYLQVRFRLLLDLDIDHFFNQGDKIYRLHKVKMQQPAGQFFQGRSGYCEPLLPTTRPAKPRFVLVQ